MHARSSLYTLRAPHTISLAAALCICMTMTACTSSQDSIVNTPMLAPLATTPINVNSQGAIYQAGSNFGSLYETPRAQRIGDVLTIVLSESYTGNDSATASASRSSNITAQAADQSTNTAAKLAKLFNIGSAATTFDGKGSVSNTSGMSGTLAVTVISTMPTGNLVVSGEKVIAMSGDRQRLRLSGIVNPKDIEAGNMVESSKVANARIEQAGVGMLADSTTMGWLQRMFLSVLTF